MAMGETVNGEKSVGDGNVMTVTAVEIENTFKGREGSPYSGL